MIKRILVGIGWPILRLLKKLAKKRKKRKITAFKRARVDWGYLGLTIITIFLTVGVVIGYLRITRELPDINKIYNPPKMSTKIVDRNGRLLYKFYQNEDRTWIKYEDIPQSLIWATVAIEDKNFWQHHGLSLKGVLTAAWYNLRKTDNKKFHGGSTITQQLVKNVFFGNENTWNRKIKEMILAIQIERQLSKEEILEKYFNEVPYGGETYGVAEAAVKYFDKKVKDLTMAEAAFLAGLPAAPSSYSPIEGNGEYGRERQKKVIEEMVNAGYISGETADRVRGEKVVLMRKRVSMAAPHFVFYVKKYLQEKFGYEGIENLGLTVKTTLDLGIQEMAQTRVWSELEKIKRLNISNGAALVVDTSNGEILAMVGSKNYNATDIDGKYNVVLAERQPGSSIKPINYLLALEKGWTLISPILDETITYNIPGQKPYKPQNYNGKYMGMVTLKTALASSLNIPSVRLLAENGVNNMIDLGEKMGITTWKNRSRYGLSLALGGGEVKMLDLAQAYSIFSQTGNKVEIQPILEIDNYLGERVWQKQVMSQRVVDAGEAFLINTVLSDDGARAPIFGTGSKLVIPGKTVAVKTGTTNNLKDNWCIGWTPKTLVAAWVGNNDGQPMSWVASGVTGATPIWNQIMKELLKGQPNEGWTIPDNVRKMKVCEKEEYFLVGSEKKVKCLPLLTPTPMMGL